MAKLIHSLNYELPQELHFDKYAQHILENSKISNLTNTTTIALANSSSIGNLDGTTSSGHQTTASDFLKKLGATFIHSIQLQSLARANSLDTSSSDTDTNTDTNTNMDFGPHHLVIDSHHYNNAMDELQKQLDYDKFMNEVWIGVVLTLILISMIFCFCSCFLYHQFRVWKRNYRTTVTQSSDVEGVKFNLDTEDPVPEYTLVSGLPSYEAALELWQKNPQSCLLLHPSVFEVFNKNEKTSDANSSTLDVTTTIETSLPLLNDSNNHNINKITLPCYNETSSGLPYNHSLASLLSLATQITTQSKIKSATSSPTASETEKQFKA